MKKVIIGIHGLGNKPPKHLLQKWWKASLLEGLSPIGVNKTLPVFEMVYWADILHKNPLNQWEEDKNNPYFLKRPYKKSPNNYVIKNHSFRGKTIDFISEQLNKVFLNEDKTLNYSFVTNVILKKFFRDLEIYYIKKCQDKNEQICKARDLIRDRLVQIIEKYKNNDIMIISHSMGSIIAFDVLNLLIPEIRINTLVTMGSPLGSPVVVSRIAADQKKKTNRKSIIATPPGITNNWYNFADIRDPVALNYKLADDFSENEKGILPIDFLVNNNYEMDGDSYPHKSYGYLRANEFSKILSEFIGETKLNAGQKVLEKVNNIVESIIDTYDL